MMTWPPSIGIASLLLAIQVCAAQERSADNSASPVAQTIAEAVPPETGPLRTRPDDDLETELLQDLLRFDSQRLRISGELREQYESWSGREFGLIPDADNDYLLQRLYLDFQLRHNEWLKTQLELGSSFQFGSPFEPSPIDEDPFYVQQWLADVTLLESDRSKSSVVMGRQTFSLGSGRLVATRNGPNVRRSFDAVRFIHDSPSWTTQVLFASDVNVGDRAFDNVPSDDRLLWGSYSTWKPGPDSMLPGKGGFDLYYLGYRNESARFDSVSGDERRHSLGLRLFGLFGSQNRWDYNIEPVLQFGKLEDQDIRAWTIASVLGYSFSELPFEPRAGIKFDVISGDQSANDQVLETFNALFPNNSYFSEAAIFAPANLYDLNLNLDAQLSERVKVVLLWDFLWRFSTQDAIYVPPGIPSIAGNASSERFIGDTISVALEWKPVPAIETTAAYVHFSPGDAVEEPGGRHSDFVLLWATMFF